MNIPSIKSLERITSYPRELRLVLVTSDIHTLLGWLHSEGKPFGCDSEFEGFTRTAKWELSCYNPPKLHALKMHMADELCETCGVEYTPAGHNSKSPAIEYLNAGDTYAATLLWVNQHYRVGCWGDIVERGDYE